MNPASSEETAPERPKRVSMTLRFAPRTYRVIKAQADKDGQSMSQWIREALLLRVGYAIGVEQGRLPQELSTEQMEALRLEVRQLLEEWADDTP